MIKWLAYIINIVWIKKTIPDYWRRGIILLFWKNKGSKEVCSNHREARLCHCNIPLQQCVIDHLMRRLLSRYSLGM